MWYKSWVEVRWRLVLMALLNTFIAALLLDDTAPAAVWRNRLIGNLPIIFAMNAIVLAGSGIASQLSQRPGQIVHPSMMFLLSLPISRKRIVLVRQAVGVIAAIGLMLATSVVYLIGAPELRDVLTIGKGAVFLGCITCVVLTAYAASALLSTVLDQLWQTYGAMGLVAIVLGGFPKARFWSVLLPTSASTNSALTPWATIATGVLACVVLTMAMLLLSVRIVQRKQF